jgi:hypothetical protein
VNQIQTPTIRVYRTILYLSTLSVLLNQKMAVSSSAASESKEPVYEADLSQTQYIQNRVFSFRAVLGTGKDPKPTPTGKSLSDTSSSDLFVHNSTPSSGLLHKFSSQLFTDEEGRRYWSQPDFKGFKWARESAIHEESWFNPTTCRIYFVRPKPGTPLSLPSVHDTIVLYHVNGAKTVARVMHAGHDEDSMAKWGSGASYRSLRKTSWVVLRFTSLVRDQNGSKI